MYPNYIEPLFRPPSEARSLIIQVTNGCSYNQCSFCEMYTAPQKKFRPKPEPELMAEIEQLGRSYPQTRRIFLADGDAMVLSGRRLLAILQQLRRSFSELQRVTAYCLPRNLNNKTDAELAALQREGLDMLYVGAESGDDTVLAKVDKGETFETTKVALNRLAEAGIRRSVMILNGLGGRLYSQQHALNSARLANATQPEYLSTLVVSFPTGEDRFREAFGGDYEPLSQIELFYEMKQLIGELELNKTVFRSDHASNYLVLKGILGRDKAKMLDQINQAIHQPGRVPLRPEWARGL
ncbi:radical SAM protein [Motiliproteus coralliicola]|uniref:Radical SAM protein n=1 Tax=Motiliproteus coralliicola TaxID=2283196 RepID=A0A369WSP7_9GAMM|nr:radical SAM protein [Motiliproteus coralliicola]RDE24712.1 radical SAM protein [Motiliproteus coralliicola]